jgi:hypothetical protein
LLERLLYFEEAAAKAAEIEYALGKGVLQMLLTHQQVLGESDNQSNSMWKV